MGQGSTSVSSVSLTNAGTIQSDAGGQAVNFNKIINGAPNSVSNSGSILATGSDAIRPGLNGTVSNTGTIKSIQVGGTGGTDGIDAQTNTGTQITNDTNGLVEGDGHSITGGPTGNTAFTATVTNNAGAHLAHNGSGINLDGFSALQTATIINHGTITGNGVNGDGDGIDVDGVITLTNTGTVKSLNSFSATTPGQSEGVTVGGGAITNSGTIEGDVASGNTNAVGRGITLAGVDTSGTPEPIYTNSTITNHAGGLISEVKPVRSSAIASMAPPAASPSRLQTTPAPPSKAAARPRRRFGRARITTRSTMPERLRPQAAENRSIWARVTTPKCHRRGGFDHRRH